MKPISDYLAGLSTAEIERLKSLAEARGLKSRKRAESPIVKVSREQPLVLSYAQQRLWFLAQLDEASAAYHLPMGLRLRGDLNVPAWQRSLDALVARHEALRTVFVSDEGQPRVVLLPATCGLVLRVQDLEHAPDAAALLEQLCDEEAHAPFDLAKGPLIRGRLIRLAPKEHVFLLTQHHIVSDGWSMGVLIRELSALYRGAVAGQENVLPPLQIQYPDYAAWQRQWLSDERLQAQAEYWRRTLAGAPAMLEIPRDRARPAQQSFEGAAVEVTFDAELTKGLKRLSQRHGTTLFMTVLSAWATVLGRLAGQEEVVIGTPSANRNRRELEGLIGFFVNMLALRIDLSGEPTVAELLTRVRGAALGGQDHQDVSFEKVVELVQPERRLDVSPIFQVMFAWQNNEEGKLDLPGLSAEPIADRLDSAKFDLELNLGEAAGEIAGGLLYSTALFERTTVERYLGYLRAVLEAMVADDQAQVGKIALLSAAERRRVLVEWNQTTREYPKDRCVHQLFEEQATKTPDALAVVFEAEQLTYAQLDMQANRLAHRLLAMGVQPGDCVATLLERGIDLVVAQLAILKSGGTYVPVDVQAPAVRQAWVVNDCGARVVLTDDAHADVEATTVLVVAAVRTEDHDVATPQIARSSRDAAYVMYTSGSTGTPKGVAVPHQGVNRLVRNNGFADFPATDRIAWLGNPAFDISTLEVWAPLLNGACLVIVSRETLLEPQALRALVQQQQVTVLHLTAGLFHQTVDVLGDALSDLRLLLVGGDLVDASAVRRVLQRWRPQHLLHCYGPTESTTFATTHEVTQVDAQTARLPIGRPIANTTVYVLDQHGEPVPQGAVGELYVGGDGVARGYLNRPELTAERFVLDRFRTTPGARMYRTGDLARHLPDGTLEFLGRNDSQVKLRGYRIELGEIEARLSQHPLVKDAVVLAREDAAGDKRLVAYVTTEQTTTDTNLVGELRRYLAELLPDYMVPSAFVRLDALPLTPNGKLDRKALPAPDSEAVLKQAYQPPQGALEEQLAAIWAELLGVEQVGRHDNFFELGGHSLLAVRLMERLRRAGLSAEVRALFAKPTLAALAESLQRPQEDVADAADVAVPANAITPATSTITPEMLPLATLSQADIDRIVALVPGGTPNVQDIYGLSPLQEGILFHHLLARQGDPYLVTVEFAFPTRELLDRYLAAVQQVVRRHDILRTAFVWEGQSTPAQVVWREAPLSVTELVLEARDPAAAAQELAKRYDPRQYRVDLTQAPLLQFVIAKEPGSERWLVLELTHHLIGDHSTLEILHKEVVAFLEGRGHELATPLPYRNLVAQARLGASEQEHERFFKELLGDIDEPTTPFGLREVHRDGESVRESRRVLPASLNDRLREQARRLRVSLASLCHLAWGQVVAKTTGREDVVFGTVLFGRMHGGVGTEQAMGLYINTLPVRLKLGEVSGEESVRRVHGVLADLLRHEHASLVLAQRCSGVAAGEPLFSALFNYRHTTAIAEDDVARRDELYSLELLGAEERTNYPLLMSVEDFGESLGLTAQIVEPIPPERVCDFMQRALEELADALERAPERPVRALDVLPIAERRRLLVEWNDTTAAHPAGTCVHQLFEEQAAKTPDAVAVVFEDEALTYGELDAKANRLAHRLRRMGVGPDARVALCLERSVEMVVGILGILKAGGAYVPLDPAYPSSRLAHMLSDSQAMALLVRERVPPAAQEALRSVTTPAPPVIDLALDLEIDAASDDPSTALRPADLGLGAHHLTYVIYTSGTTGLPKGIALPHSALVNLIRWQTATSEPRTTLQYAALGFDVSFQEIFSALCSGAKLVLIDGETRQDPQRLFQVIRAERVERLFLPCVALRMLADSADRDSAADCGLRDVITAGEQLQITPSIARFFKSLESCRLHNHYGPSETHVVTAFTLPDDVAAWPALPSIGRPIANTSIYVLDAHGAPVPQGVVGELYLGGEGVARGYLNRPELTAERFLQDPFSDQPGARMYRTGDLARYLPDGNLEFLGRNDFQVKIRGYRIELGEIETRLGQHPQVKDAVVVARAESTAEKRLVAYVTTVAEEEAGSAAELVAELRRHLMDQLPEYMVPSAFVRLAALPLTPNGKVDVRALPAPGGEAVIKRTYEAPKGEIELQLAEVWKELFGLTEVGRQDNFFELGGHSLLAATLVERLRRQGLPIPVASVFEKPILAELARRISNPLDAPGTHAVPVRRTGADAPIFFVPSGLGDVSHVFELAQELDAALPVYALPWQNSRSKGLSLTLEALATEMVALMQAVQPRGPYRVAGYSSGGLLAHAIAQRLLDAGEPVSFVGLIDTPAPDVFAAPMSSQEPLLQHIRGLSMTDEVRARLEHLPDDLSFQEMALECQRLGVEGFDDALVVAGDWQRSANYSRLISLYSPPPLTMTAHVFLANELVKNTAVADSADETAYAKQMREAAASLPILEGWRGLLPSVQPISVPGDHITMMTEAGNRSVLGAAISEALRPSAGEAATMQDPH